VTADSRFVNIPEELRQLTQWVNWRIEQRKGKPTKVPKQPSGANASSTASNTWSTFERVVQTNGQFNGIGFVFTKESGYTGIDLDKCRDPKTGETEKWALDIISKVDTYTELSQSGTGWHLIVRGSLPRGGNRKGRVEMYDCERYFCMTGALVPGIGHRKIEARDIADLQERMLAGELEPKQTAAPRVETDESAEDFRLIAEVQKEVRTADSVALEEAFKNRHPERYAARNLEKGQRAGRSYLRYSIDSFLARNPASAGNEAAPIDPGPYRIDRGRICVEKDTQHGPIRRALCNFIAHVEEEIVLDDGAETTRAFVVQGTLANGGTLPSVRVPAAKFGGMTWVADQWGFGAIVNAGLSTRDQLREAIQRLSPNPRRRHVFTHTGWRKINGAWVFLTASGAVGGDSFEVDLGAELSTKYVLPRTPHNPREAMRASLRLLNIAPLTVTVVLWAAMFRALLASAYPVDLSLWLEGLTGSLKSTLVALFLSHFGSFSEISLPGTWSSTANQLERRAFVLKDVPFVIDDYAPSGLDSRELEVKAARMLRSQGNLSGRGRLRQDLSERPAYPPRGIIIGTGEQHPPGHSILARTLLLEIDRSTVNMAALSEAQRTRSLLPHAMAACIEWLAPQMDALPEILQKAFDDTRHRATAGGEHLRVPGILANLWLGLDCGLHCAEEIGAISGPEAVGLRSRCWDALVETGARQALSIEGERPTRRFLTVLATLLAQGRAILLGKDSHCDPRNSRASFVGWQDGDFVYLLPDASFQAVAQFCKEAGEFFPVRSERLMRDFNREEVSECAAGRNTTTVNVGGQKRRVLKLRRDRAEAFLGEALLGSRDSGTEGTAGTAPDE
jgi:hypothetical protein